MKVLLVQPPIEDFYDTKIRAYPLGILYLAAKLKDICHVVIEDLRNVKKPNIIKDHPFAELKDYYRGDTYTPFSLFTNYYRFGKEDKVIQETIFKHKPDVLAVSSLFTPYSEGALQILEIAKGIDKNIVTIVGGIHPTFYAEETLRNPHVDFVIRGEGETPLFLLIEALKKKGKETLLHIPGLCFRREEGGFHIGDINYEHDIDTIPARELVDKNAYKMHGRPYTFMLTTRGCPNRCSFCGRPSVPYRKRRLQTIMDEIDICEEMGIDIIDLEDDMLTYDRTFFRQVLEMFYGRDMELYAMNGVYSETLDEEILGHMLKAGFKRLNFSLVDITPTVLSSQKRGVSSNYIKLLPFIEDSPFLLETHFIIGLPGQSPEDVINTMLFLMGKRSLLGPSIFYLAPNSRIFEHYRPHTENLPFRSYRSSIMLEVNPLFPRDITFTLMKLVRFINFVKRYIDREPSLKRLVELPELLSENIHVRHIIDVLFREKRFICFDHGRMVYIEERHERGIIENFFKRAEGLKIKGYRTNREILFNLN
ncbi:MAG: B12-binding domain-containing radical SAM protein [Syntrophorhabdaceae bacterium]|nr:B12-binding domain-containing radical SAM protein [Syntrophorhabdaceae bacterium]